MIKRTNLSPLKMYRFKQFQSSQSGLNLYCKHIRNIELQRHIRHLLFTESREQNDLYNYILFHNIAKKKVLSQYKHRLKKRTSYRKGKSIRDKILLYKMR